MSSIEINGSVIMGSVAFVTTFLIVIVSYIFLFKRSNKGDSARGDAATENVNNVVNHERQSMQSSQDLDKELDGKQEKLPKPAGMCPFAALAGMNAPPEFVTKASSGLDHIPSKVKKTEKERIQQEIEKTMSEEDKAKEREVQREQMRQIYELMQSNKETFGISDMNEVDAQMKLYM